MPRGLPSINCVYGVINTSGSVVDKYLPSNPVYLDFHNPSYQYLTLLPAELLYDTLGYGYEVVVPLTAVFPSLEPDYPYGAHLQPRIISRDLDIKTLPPKSLESTVKLINSLVISRNGGVSQVVGSPEVGTQDPLSLPQGAGGSGQGPAGVGSPRRLDLGPQEFAELARKYGVRPRDLGITPGYMYKIRRGERRPSRELVQRLLQLIEGTAEVRTYVTRRELGREVSRLELRIYEVEKLAQEVKARVEALERAGEDCGEDPDTPSAEEPPRSNLFALRVRGRNEEARVELAVLKRGYSLYLRLRTYDHRVGLEAYRRVLRLLEELGYGEPKLDLRNFTCVVYLPSKGG